GRVGGQHAGGSPRDARARGTGGTVPADPGALLGDPADDSLPVVPRGLEEIEAAAAEAADGLSESRDQGDGGGRGDDHAGGRQQDRDHGDDRDRHEDQHQRGTDFADGIVPGDGGGTSPVPGGHDGPESQAQAGPDGAESQAQVGPDGAESQAQAGPDGAEWPEGLSEPTGGERAAGPEGADSKALPEGPESAEGAGPSTAGGRGLDLRAVGTAGNGPVGAEDYARGRAEGDTAADALAACISAEIAREAAVSHADAAGSGGRSARATDSLPLVPLQPPRTGRDLLADHVTAMVCCSAVDTAGANPGLDWLDGPTLLVRGERHTDLTGPVHSLVEDGDPGPLRSWLASLGVRPEKPVRLV
ncbi:hypothetical protein L1885_14150, partial [Streptomyces fuscigenes]|nr:hypothetical protein [Streptomyces fuscigenes]